MVFSASELEIPAGESESVARGCRRGDVVARDDVIECKSLRYTVIEHFSHFPSRTSVTSRSLSLAPLYSLSLFSPFPLSLSLLLSPLLSLSRETKIEANIVAVVLPRMRSRVHIHDIHTYTRSDRITQTHTSMAHRPGETADKYMAVSRRYLRDTFAGCARRNA